LLKLTSNHSQGGATKLALMVRRSW